MHNRLEQEDAIPHQILRWEGRDANRTVHVRFDRPISQERVDAILSNVADCVFVNGARSWISTRTWNTPWAIARTLRGLHCLISWLWLPMRLMRTRGNDA